MWNDKPWYFCSKKTGSKCDGQYQYHKGADCKGKAHNFKRKAKKCKPEGKFNKERKLKLAKAYYKATLNISNEEMTSD
jgi:hypothetical protein